MPLFLDLKVGESVNIDQGRVRMTLHAKNGQRARLEFQADKAVSIEREKPSNIVAQGLTKAAPATG